MLEIEKSIGIEIRAMFLDVGCAGVRGTAFGELGGATSGIFKPSGLGLALWSATNQSVVCGNIQSPLETTKRADKS